MSIQTLTKLQARLDKLKEIRQEQIEQAKNYRDLATQADEAAAATSEEERELQQLIDELDSDLKEFNQGVEKERAAFKAVLKEVEENGLSREEISEICKKHQYPYEPEAEEKSGEEAEAGIVRVA